MGFQDPGGSEPAGQFPAHFPLGRQCIICPWRLPAPTCVYCALWHMQAALLDLRFLEATALQVRLLRKAHLRQHLGGYRLDVQSPAVAAPPQQGPPEPPLPRWIPEGQEGRETSELRWCLHIPMWGLAVVQSNAGHAGVEGRGSAEGHVLEVWSRFQRGPQLL